MPACFDKEKTVASINCFIVNRFWLRSDQDLRDVNGHTAVENTIELM